MNRPLILSALLLQALEAFSQLADVILNIFARDPDECTTKIVTHHDYPLRSFHGLLKAGKAEKNHFCADLTTA